jgi:hypothetical protein
MKLSFKVQAKGQDITQLRFHMQISLNATGNRSESLFYIQMVSVSNLGVMPAIVTEILHISGVSRETLKEYLAQDHNNFLLQPFQFTIHNTSITLIYIILETRFPSVNQTFISKRKYQKVMVHIKTTMMANLALFDQSVRDLY